MQETIQAGWVGGVSKLAIDPGDGLAGGNEESGQVLAEMAALRFVREQVAELVKGLLHDLRKCHDAGHGRASVVTGRTTSRQCTDAPFFGSCPSTLHNFSSKEKTRTLVLTRFFRSDVSEI